MEVDLGSPVSGFPSPTRSTAGSKSWRAPADGNASRWNGMPPERRPSRLQEHLRLHAAREYERAKNDPELPNQADVGRQPDVESESAGDFAG